LSLQQQQQHHHQQQQQQQPRSERCQELEELYVAPQQHHIHFPRALLVDWLAAVPFLSPQDLCGLLCKGGRGLHLVVVYVYFIGMRNIIEEDELLLRSSRLDGVAAGTEVPRVLHRRLMEEGMAWRRRSGGHGGDGEHRVPRLSEVSGLLEKLMLR
jgi:hypothetical protein